MHYRICMAMYVYCRLKSRILIVPFTKPSTGPVTAVEDAAYKDFEDKLHHLYFTSAVGWIVSLQQKLLDEGRDEIQDAKAEFQNETSHNSRSITGWSILFFFLKQVCTYRSILCFEFWLNTSKLPLILQHSQLVMLS